MYSLTFSVTCEGVILTCLLLFGSAGILKVWTGLIVSPFRSWIRIQDQIRIRIRLRDGNKEQEHGSILQGEDPDPWPGPHKPTNRNQSLIQIQLALKLSKLFFPISFGTSKTQLLTASWWANHFSDFVFFFEELDLWAKLGSKPRRGLGSAGWIKTRMEW